MEIPNNPTPHIHYGPVEPGTAAEKLLLKLEILEK